jgi:hypothetical protein
LSAAGTVPVVITRSAVVGAALLVALTGCSSAGESAVDRHAHTAGDVMTRARGPIPARAAALLVTGEVGDTRIDAMEVHGSTWGGSVTLRITVTVTRQFDPPSVSTGCYRYSFAYPRQGDWGVPSGVHCPPGPALHLSAAGLPAGVTEQTRTEVVRAVSAVAAVDRGTPSMVAQRIRAAVGPAFTVQPGTADGTAATAFTWVRYGDTCLTAQTSEQSIEVSQPEHGDDCFGG